MHAWHLTEYVTGLKVLEICAELNTFVPNRAIDDDGAAMMRMEVYSGFNKTQISFIINEMGIPKRYIMLEQTIHT